MVVPVDMETGFGEPLSAGDLLTTEELGVRLSRRGKVIWLAVAGELDVFSAPRLRTAIGDALAAPDETLVLDLRGLSFLDSSGLAVVLAAHERAEAGEGKPMRLVIRGSPAVESLFETIGAAEYLHLIEGPGDLSQVGDSA
jgi:anti-sigma B factor antagonist